MWFIQRRGPVRTQRLGLHLTEFQLACSLKVFKTLNIPAFPFPESGYLTESRYTPELNIPETFKK